MEEKNREIEISLKDIWHVFLRCWWVMVIALVVVGAGLYGFLSLTHTDLYTAQVTAYVMRDTGKTLSTTEVSITNNIIEDFVYSVTTDSVVESVIDSTGVTATPDQLRRSVQTQSDEKLHYVHIAVTAADPESAQILANAFADETCALFKKLFNGDDYARVVDYAKTPETPSNPISKVKVLAVALGAAILVYAVYFVLFLLDDKINDAEDVGKYLDVNLLGQIPNWNDVRRRKKGNGYGYYYSGGAPGQAADSAKKGAEQ